MDRELRRRLAHLLRGGARAPEASGRSDADIFHDLLERGELDGLVETSDPSAPASPGGAEPPPPETAPVPERGLEIQDRMAGPSAGAPSDGVEYLSARMFAEHPHWTVLALESSAAGLAPALAAALGVERCVDDAADAPLAEARVERFLLHLRGHRWSLLLGLPLPLSALSSRAQELSRRLGVRVVAFGYEPTGGGSVAQLFEAGRPGRAAKSRKAWPAFFRALDLFVPYFLLYSEGGRTQLVLEGVTRDEVEALAFFAGGER